MSDRIKLLPDIVANQIKAGEVVEYPSSAVKEMMENAIDAGATSVKVNFTNGGRDMIQIIDNGCGMSPTDARLAFECHATSKITSLDDIYALHTFGFRGEALSSIAAVSQVELITRQAEAEVGTKTIINGGEFVSQTPVAAPVGSQFIVRNIFYNTPVRRKFIDNRESRLPNEIKSEFRRVALCHPEVAFELMSAGAPLYNLPQSNLAERIVGIMGSAMRNNLLEVDVTTSIAQVKGFIGRPLSAKMRGADQYMFVNGRYFHSAYLNKAVIKAYEKLIPNGAQPSFFIYLTVDAERVDVNVHAKKTEVKFADNEAIWQIINAAVRETLAKTGAISMMDFENEVDVDIPVATRDVVYSMPRATTREHYNPFEESSEISAGQRTVVGRSALYDFTSDFESGSEVEDYEIPSAMNTAEESGSEFEFIDSQEEEQHYIELESTVEAHPTAITYLGKRYASALINGSLRLIDLTRARQRILYNRYIASLDCGRSASQQLLFPETLRLSTEEWAVMEEWAVDFAALGFDIELQEGNAIEVRGIPGDIEPSNIESSIFYLLQELALPHSVETMRRERIALSLARSATSHRTNYSQAEAEAIVEAWIACRENGTTPSGGNISTALTLDDIERLLG